MDNIDNDDMIDMNQFIESNTEQSIEPYSNFNDVIKEDYNETEINETVNKDNYFYQPQFTDEKNICILKVVGYQDEGKKPVVKIGEFDFVKDKWLILSHLYNNNEIEKINNKEMKYIDIFSIVLNKDNIDMAISIRYTIKEIIENKKFKGIFHSIARYKKTKEGEKTIILKELKNFNINKGIEILIKEMLNPNIIDIIHE
jgi:hypothetical protein